MEIESAPASSIARKANGVVSEARAVVPQVDFEQSHSDRGGKDLVVPPTVVRKGDVERFDQQSKQNRTSTAQEQAPRAEAKARLHGSVRLQQGAARIVDVWESEYILAVDYSKHYFRLNLSSLSPNTGARGGDEEFPRIMSNH